MFGDAYELLDSRFDETPYFATNEELRGNKKWPPRKQCILWKHCFREVTIRDVAVHVWRQHAPELCTLFGWKVAREPPLLSCWCLVLGNQLVVNHRRVDFLHDEQVCVWSKRFNPKSKSVKRDVNPSRWGATYQVQCLLVRDVLERLSQDVFEDAQTETALRVRAQHVSYGGVCPKKTSHALRLSKGGLQNSSKQIE